jgi:hypothetical protein
MLRSATLVVSTLALLGLFTLAATGCAQGLGEELLWTQGGDDGGPLHTIYTGTAPPMVAVAPSSSASSASSSGGSTCDASNDCSTCGNCATSTVCLPAMNACETDQSCSALLQCLSSCQDQTCADGCAAQNPGGQQPYLTVVTCVLCQACPVSCAAESMGACGP